MSRLASILYGPELHHLDHLAPLSVLLGIPLIVTEESIATLAARYYPDLQVLFWDYLEVGKQVIENYNVLITCMPRALFEETFFLAQTLSRRSIATIWCPHGNSDKGWAIPLMEALSAEQALLVYGNKMLDFLKAKGVSPKHYVVIGNYRYHYYCKYKPFYTHLLHENNLLKPNTFLYAPTWEDGEKSSSFFHALPSLLQIPPDTQLIVKLHPNLLLQDPLKTEAFLWRHEHPQLTYLTEFPPIYPLLDLCDAYIGDMSSIGYDFLTFNKPMYFLNQNNRDAVTDPGLYLFRCGIQLSKEHYSDIYALMKTPSDLSKIRKELYAYTFEESKKWPQVQEGILNLAARL